MTIQELARTAEQVGFHVRVSKDAGCKEYYNSVPLPMRGWVNVSARIIDVIGDCDFSIRVALAHEVGHAMTLPRDGRAHKIRQEFNEQYRWCTYVDRALGELVIGYELLAWRWAMAYVPDIPLEWAQACMRSYTRNIRPRHKKDGMYGQHV